MGGSNTRANIVPQNADVNHKGYYAMEQGERNTLRDGAQIQSDKTAFASTQPGHRPDAFMVNDEITYSDGHKESLHQSFQNESYANQESWNEQSASFPGTFDGSNPGDGLRGSMTSEEYSDLMEETENSLPGISDEYAASDFSGAPSGALDTDSGIGASTAADEGSAADAGDNSADSDCAGADSGADADGGADSDPD